MADFQKLSRYNKGYRYLLVAVECLSRRAFAAPVKNKKAPAVQEAFEKIFAEMPVLPWKLFTDRGTEFDSRIMRTYYESKDIIKRSAENPDTKAAMAERMIKTVKHRLYRYFTENQTLVWVNAVPLIVRAINNSVNRITGLRPVDFTFKNSRRIWRRLYSDAFEHAPRSTLKAGDNVRIAKPRTAFKKGYLPNYSGLTYRIRHVKRGKPNTFLLEGAKGRNIKRKYYREEVTPAARPPDLEIERVLRTKTVKGHKHYLVKWVGEPEESASWITEDDIPHIS